MADRTGALGRTSSRALTLGMVAVALAAAGCGSSSKSSGPTGATSGNQSKTPYKVVQLASATGLANSTGVPGQNGTIAAVDAINAAGGVNGHKIELVNLDSQSTAAGAGAAVNQAVGDHPIAIISNDSSTDEAAEDAVLGPAQIPVVASASDDADLTKPWYFTTGVSPSQLGAEVVGTLKNALGGSLQGKRVAIEAIQATSVDSDIPILEGIVKNGGGSITTVQRSPFGAASFASGAANIVATHPDGVITLEDSPDEVVVTKALATAGFSGPMVGGSAASDSQTMKTIALPDYVAVREGYEPAPGDTMYTTATKYGVSPNGSYFNKGWAAAYMVAQALSSCGDSCTTSSVSSALAQETNYTVPGSALFGPISASSTRHNVLTTGQPYVWDSGKGQAVISGAPVDYTSTS